MTIVVTTAICYRLESVICFDLCPRVALIMTSLNIFTSENMLHDSKDGSIDDGYVKFNSTDFVTNGLLSVDDSQPGEY